MDELFEALENTNKSNLPTGFVDWLKQPGNLDVMEKFLTETNKNIKSIQLRKAADARKQYEEFCPALVIVTAKVNQGAYGLLVNSNIPNYDPKHYSIDTTTRYGTTPGSLRSILQIHKENKIVKDVRHCALVGNNEAEYYAALAGYHLKHYSPKLTIEHVESMPEIANRIKLIASDKTVSHVDKILAIMPLVAACW